MKVGRMRALVNRIGEGLAIAVGALAIYHFGMILLLGLGELFSPGNILPQGFVGMLGVVISGACFILEMNLGELRSVFGASFKNRHGVILIGGLVVVVEGVLYYIYFAGFKGLGCSLSILGTVGAVLGAFTPRRIG